MAKYTTLTELAAAFQSGELDRRDYFLMLDKGGNSMSLRRYTCGLSNEEIDASIEECDKIFKRAYDCPVEELCKLAGINSEWC